MKIRHMNPAAAVSTRCPANEEARIAKTFPYG